MGILERAISFAADRHAGAVRKGSDIPYIVHPMEAVSIAAGITDDEEILAAAALHDVVEDTQTTLAEIETVFGGRVAGLVASESEDKMRDVPPSESWKARKQATIKALQSAASDEKIVVLADKLSNIRALSRDILCVGDSVWEKFNQKDKRMHEWYYRSIADAISDLAIYPAYQEFCQLIDTVFGVDEQMVETSGIGRKNYKLDLLEELADSGNKDAMFDVVRYYYNRIGKDLTEGKRELMINYLLELSNDGNKDAMLLLGTMYYDGKGIEQRYKNAIVWYERAAEKLDSYALCNLGYCYYYGRDIEIDYAKAYSYFSQSTFLRNPNAAYKLGDMFYFGYHVKEDKNAAFYWYNEALSLVNDGDYEIPNIKYRL